MGSQQPHSDGPKGKAEQSTGGHIPDIVRPGKHPQGADEQGHHHHAGPGGGVEVAPHGGQHGGGAVLTPEARRLLDAYEAYVADVDAYSRKKFDEAFGFCRGLQTDEGDAT